jgi:hypothetical protein
LSFAVTLPQFFANRVQNAVAVSGVQSHAFAVPPPPQVCGAMHVPHDATVRDVPQLSVPVTLPQFLPSRVQNAAFVSGAHPHTFAVPPPPHETPVPVHAPQEATARLAPQLSAAVTEPQFFLIRVQNARSVSELQQTPLLSHVCGDVHAPQELTTRFVSQLSKPVTLPQVFFNREQNAGSLSGAQASARPSTSVAFASASAIPESPESMLLSISVEPPEPSFPATPPLPPEIVVPPLAASGEPPVPAPPALASAVAASCPPTPRPPEPPKPPVTTPPAPPEPPVNSGGEEVVPSLEPLHPGTRAATTRTQDQPTRRTALAGAPRRRIACICSSLSLVLFPGGSRVCAPHHSPRRRAVQMMVRGVGIVGAFASSAESHITKL